MDFENVKASEEAKVHRDNMHAEADWTRNITEAAAGEKSTEQAAEKEKEQPLSAEQLDAKKVARMEALSEIADLATAKDAILADKVRRGLEITMLTRMLETPGAPEGDAKARTDLGAAQKAVAELAGQLIEKNAQLDKAENGFKVRFPDAKPTDLH
ncbi:MAG: hypothetical protein Q8O53_03120 [Candidatus Moranbacteria bacterium]|nr:hypothetical protein [Candidatus Moranbacteria bacterium]